MRGKIAESFRFMNRQPPTRRARNSLDAITTIHRQGDAYVNFYRKRDGNLKPTAALRVDELREWFPEIVADVLAEDSYMTVNGYFCPRSLEEKFSDHGAGQFPPVSRKETNLRALNAAFVDLDVGRGPDEKPDNPASWMGVEEADYEVMKLAAADVIPYPSIVSRSGRGIYLLWLLVDVKNPDLPPPGFKPGFNFDLYKRINAEINERLQPIAADKAAKDGARILRVPESIHGGTKKRVRYRVQCGDDGNPLTYTLAELAEFLGIKAEKTPPPRRHRREPRKKRPKMANGRKALARYRIADIEAVAKEIGIQKGNRRVILTHYAECHRIAETYPRDTQNACYQLAHLCNPPYPSDANDTPVGDIVRQTYNLPAWAMFLNCRCTNEYLCGRLRITPDLCRRLELQTILTPEVRAKRKAEPSAAQKRIAARQAFLRDLMGNPATTDLSCKRLAIFANACGFKCTPMTVSRDLRAMGLRETRGRTGRPKKNPPETVSLPLAG